MEIFFHGYRRWCGVLNAGDKIYLVYGSCFVKSSFSLAIVVCVQGIQVRLRACALNWVHYMTQMTPRWR